MLKNTCKTLTAWLRRHREVRSVRLPLNLQHGTGLDIGMLLARTRRVVALDVDAFPISSDWLGTCDRALDSGAAVVGAEVEGNDFVHPSFLGIDVRRFRDRRLTVLPGDASGYTGDVVSRRASACAG